MGVSLVSSFFRIWVIAQCPCNVHNLPLRFLRKQAGGHCGSLKIKNKKKIQSAMTLIKGVRFMSGGRAGRVKSR